MDDETYVVTVGLGILTSVVLVTSTVVVLTAKVNQPMVR